MSCHFLLQGNLPKAEIEPWSSCIAGRFFTVWATREVLTNAWSIIRFSTWLDCSWDPWMSAAWGPTHSIGRLSRPPWKVPLCHTPHPGNKTQIWEICDSLILLSEGTENKWKGKNLIAQSLDTEQPTEFLYYLQYMRKKSDGLFNSSDFSDVKNYYFPPSSYSPPHNNPPMDWLPKLTDSTLYDVSWIHHLLPELFATVC